MKNNSNMLLVANWESNVGYAWWLMENFWVTIATHLKYHNIDSVLIYPKITVIPDNISSIKIKVIEHNFQDTSITGLLKLRKILKDYNIRYIYLTDNPTYRFLYVILHSWGIKTIIVHDHTPGERTTAHGIIKFLKSLIQRIPYFTADHFIAVTDFVFERFLKVSCIPYKKCSCASNGIEPIDLKNSDKYFAHNNFGIDKNKMIVISTGRATRYKGIDFFIECANELINKRKNTSFLFLYCGDGPDIEIFRNMVSNYGLENDFLFLGKRNDVRDILPSCDIGFHAAIGEVGYSLSILEYMSAGLVTIVPDNPSTCLSINHGINGYKYIPNNVNSAVEMIMKSLDKDLSTQVTKTAINDVKTNYNIKKTNDLMRNVLNKTILEK